MSGIQSPGNRGVIITVHEIVACRYAGRCSEDRDITTIKLTIGLWIFRYCEQHLVQIPIGLNFKLAFARHTRNRITRLHLNNRTREWFDTRKGAR